MSDKDTTPATAETTSATAANEQPRMVIHTQYVKDLSFESPNSPQVFSASSNDGGEPKIDITVSAATNPMEQKRVYEVVLNVSATAKRNDETMFVAEVAYAAIVSMNKDVDEKFDHPMAMIEGPRHIFPYARQAIGELTRNGGFAPVNLQTIDFARVYQQGMASRNQQAGDASADDGTDAIDIKADAKADKKSGKGKK